MCRLRIEQDRLRLEEGHQSLASPFTADPGLFETSKGDSEVRFCGVVADGARLQLAGHLAGALRVLGEKTAAFNPKSLSLAISIACSSRYHPRAFRSTARNIALYTFALTRRGQRPHLRRRCEGISDPDRGKSGGQRIDDGTAARTAR
jgi:hypothetical protein